jgi:O-antigen/teichoic acid export membrane protein
MTTITLEWDRDVKQFRKIVISIMGLIAVGTVMIVIGGHFIGRHLLELVYDVNLSSFKKEFIILLFGGGISASVYILYNLLIAIRHEKCIIAVYGITAVLMTKIGFEMVKGGAMEGASWAYFISCLILYLIFVIILMILIRKKWRSQCKNTI